MGPESYRDREPGDVRKLRQRGQPATVVGTPRNVPRCRSRAPPETHSLETHSLSHAQPLWKPIEKALLRRGARDRFVEALREGVPREGGALDAHWELHDALKSLEVAELDLRVGRHRLVGAVEALLVY